MKILLPLLFCLWCALPAWAQSRKIDSLLREAQMPLPDTQKVWLWGKIAWELRSKDFKKALLYADKSIALAEKVHFRKGLAESFNYKGVILRNLGEYDKALACYLQAQEQGRYIKQARIVGYSYNNIGEICKFQKKYNEAERHVHKGLAIFQQVRDPLGEAYCFLRLGEIAQARRDYKRARTYYEKCLRLREQFAHGQDVAITYVRLASVAREQDMLDDAIQQAEKARSIFAQNNDQNGLIGAWLELSKAHKGAKNTQASLELAYRALKSAEELSASEFIKQASQLLHEEYAQKGDYQLAYKYQSIFLIAKDSLQQQDLQKAIFRIETNSKIQEQEMKLHAQTTQMRWIMGIGGLAFLVLVAFLVNLYRVARFKERANRAMEAQKQEIEAQHAHLKALWSDLEAKNNIIAKKNEDTTASITYAQNIQKAILPHREEITDHLPHHFVFYRPRDIVSGDFYWFAHKAATDFEPQKHIFVVGDCTGHGVPGAFMTMVATALLNQIVHDAEIHTPELILKEMNDKVYRNLNQYQSKNRDGMEVSICVILPTERRLRFAGAGNSLIYVQNNELQEIKGELGSVGGYQTKTELAYIGTDLMLDVPTMVYMYSDGMQDQFGGAGKKRFMTKRFKKMLYDVHKIPTDLQADVIQQSLDDWKGEEHQIDDITVAGIMLNFA